jgi:hypothetical protein
MSTIQVDRIIPYQSASVTIDGDIVQANAATTGSNTFVGDQNIQGTITASIQEGFVLAGGVGNVSTLVATSSFGGGGSGFPFTGDAVITGSLSVSGSTSIIPVVAPNGAPGGLVQYIIPFLSGSSNTFARDQDNALAWVPLFNQLAISSSTANTAITPGGMTLASGTTGSTVLSTSRVSSVFGTGRHLGITGDAAGTNLTGLAGITTPAIIAQSGSAGSPTFYTPIQFQASQSFTDGRVTVTTPLVLQQGSVITGTQIITGSGFTNTFNQFKSEISGSNALHSIFAGSQVISGSSHRNTQSQRTIEVAKPGFDYPVFLATYTQQSSSVLLNYTDNLTQTASYNLGVFDNGFTQDVELFIDTTITHGVQFKDIDSSTGAYITFLKIAPNGGTNPPLEFKRGMQVTGSVSVSDVLQLAQKDPLPTGAVGQLAVSASNLYYHNGSSWSQIN